MLLMKIYRSKRRSCPLCKPHKTGHAPRFTSRELAARKEAEKELLDVFREKVSELGPTWFAEWVKKRVS